MTRRAIARAVGPRASTAVAAVGQAGSATALRWRPSRTAAACSAPRPAHHEPKAKNLIVIFLTGGFSHVDTFDYKPSLSRHHGKPVPSFGLRSDETGKRPLWARRSASRRAASRACWISELFPHLGTLADELCVIRSLHTDIVEHFQAVLAMHTGSATVPLPSLGAWLSYGLGTFNPNLPSYMVLCEHMPYAGSQVWDSNFLPPIHQGVRIVPGAEPIPDLRPPARPVDARGARADDAARRQRAARRRRAGRRRPARADRHLRRGAGHDARGARGARRPTRDARRRSTPTASRRRHDLVRLPVPDRPPAGRAGRPRGRADRHRLEQQLGRPRQHAGPSPQGPAGGPGDRRLDPGPEGSAVCSTQTLVAICTEFGRTPWTDSPGTKGRNHYAKAFTALLAGAGVKGGMRLRRRPTSSASTSSPNPVHVHDYHATILHLMGIDHTRLIYRYAGRDFRLTDVAGKVIPGS